MKEVNWKRLAKDLMDIVYDLKSNYHTCRYLIEYGWDYDDLVEMGFDKDDIIKATNDDMHNRDYD
jgi:hypothetical protein